MPSGSRDARTLGAVGDAIRKRGGSSAVVINAALGRCCASMPTEGHEMSDRVGAKGLAYLRCVDTRSRANRNRNIVLDRPVGLSYKELVARYGLTERQIRRVLREGADFHELPRAAPPAPLSSAEADRVMAQLRVEAAGLR